MADPGFTKWGAPIFLVSYVILRSTSVYRIFIFYYIYYILSSSPMGWVPLPRSFPISWYCKLDTGMQQPKLYPELQMQQMLQLDWLLRPCQFDRAWCSFPGKPHSEPVYLNNPPTKIYFSNVGHFKCHFLPLDD